jgi:signal transduction histidine kinase
VASDNKEKCVPEDFLANLVHDLRAPVVTIGALAKRLLNGKMGDLNPEQKKVLNVILRNCERLEYDVQMVSQHMKVGLVERLSLKVFDIEKIAERVYEALKPEADEKGVALRFQAPAEAVSIEADPFIIEKAIFNLLDNAVRHTDQGGHVQVTLSLHDELVEINVADDGEGMEKKKLDLVLQPFEEVMGVRDRELRGFGLGLANVKQYAELHGGALKADSTPGKGSVFTIQIPRQYKKRGHKRE